MEEHIGHVLKRTELEEGLILEKKTCLLGVLVIVFEFWPDALVQIASLAIRGGNGLLLKRGKEAKSQIWYYIREETTRKVSDKEQPKSKVRCTQKDNVLWIYI